MNFVFVEGGGVETPKILQRILKLRKIALILAGIGAWYYGSMVFDPENMEMTRISEHALMPGLVSAKFDKSGLAVGIYRDLAQNPSNPQYVICKHFHSWHLSCHHQNWHTNLAGAKMTGRNVYAWIRGQRNDGGEAQLIGVRIGGAGDEQRAQRNIMIAQIMAFANYAKDQVYWSRDIVFVFADGETLDESAIGFDAFLQQYHLTVANANYSTPTVISSDELKEQCGLLIAGVVYEPADLHKKSKGKVMSAATNGINGQQANLDLFNAAAKIASQKLRAGMALFGVYNDPHHYKEHSWPYLIPIRAIYGQAFVAVEGLHSILGKYSVPAITIGLAQVQGPENGIFVESMCRMLNNALERLHQSYFMYVLGDDLHFASIAYYLPILGIIAFPLLISAYAEWREIRRFEIPAEFLIAHVLGFALFTAAHQMFTKIGTQLEIPDLSLPPTDIGVLFLLACLVPFGGLLGARASSSDVGSIRLLCQLETCLVIGCLGLVNFGVALFGAIVAVPMVFVMTYESISRSRSIFRTIFLFFANPILIASFAAIHSREYLEYPQISENPYFDLNVTLNLINRMIRENALFGSAHLPIFCLFALPIWNLLFISAMTVSESENQPSESESEKLKSE